MSDRCFKVYHSGHCMTQGHHLYVHGPPSNYMHYPEPFINCKDLLGRFSGICQLKPEVHQAVTFANIRSLSKWNYSAAYLIQRNSQQHWLVHQFQFNNPGSIQSRQLEQMCLTPSSLQDIFHLLQKKTRWRVSPSHTFHLFFIILHSALSPCNCQPLSYSSPVVLNLFPFNPIS